MVKLQFKDSARAFHARLKLASDEVSTWPAWKIGSRSEAARLHERRAMTKLKKADYTRMKADIRKMLVTWIDDDIHPRATEINDAMRHVLLDLMEESLDVDIDWRLYRPEQQ